MAKGKARKDNEELVKVGYRLPPDLIKRLEESAIANRRSINDELIVILEDALENGRYFSIKRDMPAFLEWVEGEVAKARKNAEKGGG